MEIGPAGGERTFSRDREKVTRRLAPRPSPRLGRRGPRSICWGRAAPKALSRLLVPRPARRVVNVENLHRIARDPVENLVGILPNRDDANARALCRSPSALRPVTDPADDRPDPQADGGCYCRKRTAR